MVGDVKAGVGWGVGWRWGNTAKMAWASKTDLQSYCCGSSAAGFPHACVLQYRWCTCHQCVRTTRKAINQRHTPVFVCTVSIGENSFLTDSERSLKINVVLESRLTARQMRQKNCLRLNKS